jgi:hypothetical protein
MSLVVFVFSVEVLSRLYSFFLKVCLLYLEVSKCLTLCRVRAILLISSQKSVEGTATKRDLQLVIYNYKASVIFVIFVRVG